MNIKQERADFEAWTGYSEEALSRNAGDGYCIKGVDNEWRAYQAGRAAQQSQKPEPNDVMLSGVIRMPIEMAMATDMSRIQFYHRAQQALNELEALQSQDREECSWQYDEDEDAYQTGCGNLFIILDGTPSENRMSFCHYCGKPIQESIDHARHNEGES